MRVSKGRRLVAGVLAGTVGLLVLLNGYLVQSSIDISPVVPQTDKADVPRQGDGQPATALDKKSAEQFQETVGRPLFNPGRRPVQRVDTAAKEPKVEPSELRLIGVMKSANRPPRALLRFANEPTGKWIAEGAEFNGWKLRKVNERSVIVQAGERSQELTLSTPRRAPDEPPAR